MRDEFELVGSDCFALDPEHQHGETFLPDQTPPPSDLASGSVEDLKQVAVGMAI